MNIYEFNDFDINQLPSSCIINDNNFLFGLSKWVSPKRTRSYPYERVYNTLGSSKRITVIPIIKDEGKGGDRDFIQWDTISLMSLLDVFVVLSYYEEAEKNLAKENKITKQKFNNELVKNKIREIKNYHSSALHWNLKEIKKSLPNLIQRVKQSYKSIGKELSVEFHSEKGIEKFSNQFADGLNHFMLTSRQKAKKAQNREVLTVQPKESLSTSTKATITIENYLGGKYYFTIDEMEIVDNDAYLIEGKHSKNSSLPSLSDIKDVLLKMILYTNLKNVMINGMKYNPIPVVKLTATGLSSGVSSKDDLEVIKSFSANHNFSKKKNAFLQELFYEANSNNFIVTIEKSE